MKGKKWWILGSISVVIILAILGSLYIFVWNDDEDSDSDDATEETALVETQIQDETSTPEPEEPDVSQLPVETPESVTVVYTRSSNLLTVADDLMGYNYSNSSGTALINNTDLLVTFNQLPDISSDFFYEGWLVKSGSFISTGEVLKNNDGVFVDTYSGTGLDDYTRYVLTLEPRDNDPAPADHVVENDFVTIN